MKSQKRKAVASLLLTACGKGGGTGGGTGTVGASAGDNPSPATSPAKEQGYVYLPETVTIEGERADYGNMQLIGDSLYYLTRNGEEESVFTSDAGIWLYAADGKFLGNVPYSPSGNARTGNGSQTEEIQVKGTFCADDGNSMSA